MTAPLPPARVTGIVARDAPVAVLFRRGPSKQVLQLLWSLKTDEITPGQWLKGRVYDARSDLSPDGRHLLYFASHNKPDPVTHGSYMVIATPPFFTAHQLFPVGHTWSGYGQFVDNRRFWALRNPISGLEASFGRAPGLREVPVPRNEAGQAEFNMTLHRGWRFVSQTKTGTTWRDQVNTVLWHKDIAPGWGLERRATMSVGTRGPNNEVEWDVHRLVGPEGETPLNTGWAEVYRGDVLFADQGCVYRLTPGQEPREIADLSPYSFQSLRAPYPGVNMRAAGRNRPARTGSWHPLDGEEA